jgi:type IV pilus assembly protein PilA
MLTKKLAGAESRKIEKGGKELEMFKTKYPILKSLHRGEKGFTLIELLIVVAILAIIAAVVIPNISRFMVTGTLSAANSEVEQVKTAALGYFAGVGNNTWAQNSSTLVSTGYISGTMKAEYTFDTSYGWVLSGTPTPTGWQGINFTGGIAGSTGQHGRWVAGS